MSKSHLLRILKTPINLLANAIAKVSVNQIAESGFDNNHTIQKSRARWGWPIIVLGNIVFASRNPRLNVLHSKDWLEWEQLLRRTLLNESVQLESNKLVCQKIVGQSLSELLTGSVDKAKRDKLIELATRSLAILHSKSVQIRGTDVVLSHGDAATYNVLIDQVRENAVWFDFDLRHDLRSPAEVRQADDLRSLVFSITRQVEPEEISECIALVRNSYERNEIWRQLAKQVSHPSFAFDIFHLAQIRRVRSGRALKTSHVQLDQLVTEAIKRTNTATQTHGKS